MSDWVTDNKGAGPWRFTPQPDKWGYLNNPRWTPTPQAPTDYSSNLGGEPQIWTPNAGGYPDGGSDIHFPCGHWHKGIPDQGYLDDGEYYQQSIDVYKGRMAMVAEDTGSTRGIIGCVDYFEGEWAALGSVTNIDYYLEPNTTRISGSAASDYIAHYMSYWMMEYEGDRINYLGIFRFSRDASPTSLIGWESNVSTGIPYSADDSAFYNTMDCVGDRLACLAFVFKVNNVSYRKMQVKVSEDGGKSWSHTVEWTDAITTYPYSIKDRAMLRMSQDGTVWICYVRSGGAGHVHNVEVWESNSDVTSFSKQWEKDFYSDLNDNEAWRFCYDINDEDGSEQVITLGPVYEGPGDYYYVTYHSHDSASTFTTTVHNNATNIPASRFSGDSPNMAVMKDGDEFMLSSDGGVNFSDNNVSPISLSGSYIDHQHHYNEMVYAECGADFHPPGAEAGRLSLLYSDDNGGTWEVRQSPFNNGASSREIRIPYPPEFRDTGTYYPPDYDDDGERIVIITDPIIGGSPNINIYIPVLPIGYRPLPGQPIDIPPHILRRLILVGAADVTLDWENT